MARLRSQLFSFLAQHPRLRAGARRAYFGLWQQRASLRARLSGRGGQPPRTILVDPGRIRSAGVGWARIPEGERSLRVLEGEWDFNVIPVEQLDAYQAAVGRYVHGRAWEHTAYYR